MVIPQTDEPGGLQSKGVAKDLDMTVQLNNTGRDLWGENPHPGNKYGLTWCHPSINIWCIKNTTSLSDVHFTKEFLLPFILTLQFPYQKQYWSEDHSKFEKQATLKGTMNVFTINTRYFTRYKQQRERIHLFSHSFKNCCHQAYT